MTDFIALTDFDASTVGSAPSGWTESGTTGKWTVQTAPSGLSGRSLRGVRSSTDAYLSKSFTRQTSGTVYTYLKFKSGSTTVAGSSPYYSTGDEWFCLRLLDGSNPLQEIVFIGTKLYVAASDFGSYTAVVTLAASTVYALEIAYSVTSKKITSIKVNGTTYNNGGSGWAYSSATSGFDTIRFDSYSGVTSGSEYMWLDDILVTDTQPVPTAGTLAGSGTLSGATLGCNRYGMAVLGYTEAAGAKTYSFKVERSADGGTTWADVSANCTWYVISGTDWKVIDRRPQYGSQATTWGGSAKYRVSPIGLGGTGSATSSVTVSSLIPDKRQVILDHCADKSSYMAGSYQPSVTWATYPADTMVEMAVGYLESVRNGSAVAQYKTDVINQFNYIKNTLTNADGLIQFPGLTTYIYLDHHARTAHYAQVAATLLYKAGATTDAQTIITQVDVWAKAMWDKLGGGSPLSTVTFAGTQANSQTAWASNVAIAAGEIRRPTSTNGRSYRAMNAGTTSSTQPTWPTSTGGTVTDNAGSGHSGTPITWRETSATGSVFSQEYNPSSPYASALAPSTYYTVNMHIEVAALFALLTKNAMSSFSSAGTYRTKALQYITDSVGCITAGQFTNGSVPLDVIGSAGSSYVTATDYAGFASQSMAVINSLYPGQHPAQDLYLSRMVDWLMSVYNASEPLTGVTHWYLYDPDSPQDPYDPIELLFPYNAALITGKSTGNIENIALSGAFWDEATGRYGDYDANGNVDHFDVSYNHISGPYDHPKDCTFDSYGIYETIFVADAVTRGSATFTGRAATNTQTDTATRGSATAAGRIAESGEVAGDAITDSATRGSATAYGRTASDLLGGPSSDPGSYRMFFDLSPFL